MDHQQSQPKHTWTSQDRLTLALFSKLYENGLKQHALVFSEIVADALLEEGVPGQVPASAIQAQLKDMQQSGRLGYNEWREMHEDSSIAEVRSQSHYQALRDMIEDTALRIGVTLRLRVRDPEKPNPGMRRRSFIEGALADGHFSSSDDSDNDEFWNWERLDLTPGRDLSPGLPTPPRSDESGKKASCTLPTPVSKLSLKAQYDKSPHLVYRWWCHESQGSNSANGFYAGKFVNAQVEIPTPVWDFENINNHIGRKEISTPYISFRDNLQSTLSLALRASPILEPCLAIIDFQKLRTTSTARWGKDTAIQAAPELIQKFDLRHGKSKNYHGRGEWLVYGTVSKEAIVKAIRISDFVRHVEAIPRLAQLIKLEVLKDTREARRLWRNFKDVGTLNWHSGFAIRTLTEVMGIDEPHRTWFASDFASKWTMRGHTHQETEEARENFEKGVQGERQGQIDYQLHQTLFCPGGEQDDEDNEESEGRSFDRCSPWALDTFTAELLAEADACSTVGSFGRGPSSARAVSEVVRILNEGYGKPSNTKTRDRQVDSRSRRELVVISDSEDGEEDALKELRAVKRRTPRPINRRRIPKYGDRNLEARRRLKRQRSSLISSSRSPRKFFRA